MEESETLKVETKPRRSRLGIILLFLLILVLLGVGFYLAQKMRKNSPTQSQKKTDTDKAFSGDLAPVVATADSAKAVTKTLGPAGGILQTESADGTLYTLTVPGDAIILPTTVTMTPLTSSPIQNYGSSLDKGVSLSGKFSFIRPTYLTVQPQKKKPTEKIKFNYCAVGSRGYDPEVCAGVAGIPLGAGVAPGQVIIFSSIDREEVLLQPTIYTGMKDTYNAVIFAPGNYFADIVNKKQLESLTQKTFDGSNDYINRTEVLIHLLALGGDLSPYKDEIERFAREKKDYPREVLKGAIIALGVNDTITAKARTESYKTVIANKSRDIRSSFVAWTRYAAIVDQVRAQKNKSHKPTKTAKGWLLEKAHALQDWADVAGNTNDSSAALPDYEGDNGVDYHDGGSTRSWSDIWNDLFPSPEPAADNNSNSNPNIRDWSDIEAEDAAQQQADSDIAKGCIDTINSKNATPCEKAQAVRTLIALKRVTGADVPSYSAILEKCSNECLTMAECEDMGDLGENWGIGNVVSNANSRIIIMLKESETCDLVHKKGLADYGNNSCEQY